MVTRRALLRVAGAVCVPAAAARAAAPDDTILLRVEAILPPGGPLVQEMVKLTVRAVFKSQPNQVTLEQPGFPDARWLALGDDTWGRISLGGPSRVLLERRLAWFAQRSGVLSVGAFTLRAEMPTPDGARPRLERRTAPFSIAVGPAAEDSGAWWLPARSLRIAETWTLPPQSLAPGQVTRRTLVVTASGIEAAQLPPLPPLDAPGVIAFAQPATIETTATPDGLVTRATYAWDLKPVSAAPATLPEIRLPWFDTGARQMTETVLPAARVSLAGRAPTPPPPSLSPGPPASEPASSLPAIAAGASAFLLGSAALHAPRLPARALRDRLWLAWAARRAIRAGDAAGLRALLAGAMGSRAAREAVAALDRHLYADTPAPMPNLRRLPRALLGPERRAQPPGS